MFLYRHNIGWEEAAFFFTGAPRNWLGGDGLSTGRTESQRATEGHVLGVWEESWVVSVSSTTGMCACV